MTDKRLTATVKKDALRLRKGRGFSRKELASVGLNFNAALKIGLSVDPRRSTAHEANIRLLKEHLEHLKKSVKPEAAAAKAAPLAEAEEIGGTVEKAERKEPRKGKRKPATRKS